MTNRNLTPISEVTVVKLNFQGQEAWRYPGEVLQRTSNSIVIQAYFNRGDMLFHGLPFHRGDRFVETYYSDRWYNIFEMHAREDDALRGWYCNITRPAHITNGLITYVDLALDLLVFPDGRQLVLDEDEYDHLPLSPQEDYLARQALADLQSQFRRQLTG